MPADLATGFIIRRTSIFLKYQNYYDVWSSGFNIDGMNDLVAEIKDGLK
jgi:hypothetical protein